jgi:hypothetical protein
MPLEGKLFSILDDSERAYYHFRVRSEVIEGQGRTEDVIKICIAAFPSLWVSRNTAF